MSVLYKAKDLRNNIALRKEITREHGVYKWWCEKDLLDKFLGNLDIKFNDIISDLEKKTIDKVFFYCVYVGDSTKLYNRFFSKTGHICGLHNRRNVEKGFLSTYRVTISSILFRDQSKERETNEVIDQMLVEVFDNTDDINAGNFHTIQNQFINEMFRPLNNDDIDKENKTIYSEERHYSEPISKTAHFRKSWKITELRNLGREEGLKYV